MATEKNITITPLADSESGKGTNLLFPVFLKLEEMRVLVVGGGKVGLEKLSAILGNAPDTTVTVVAKQISEEIKELAKIHRVYLHERAFTASDLDEKDVAIIAVNDREVSQFIRDAAKEKKNSRECGRHARAMRLLSQLHSTERKS